MKKILDETLEGVRKTRVALTPTVYYSTYLTMDDMLKDVEVVYVYCDGITIELMSNGKYHLLLERSEYEFDTLSEAEQFLWDDWLKNELNH